jgi:hypothetical protein
MRKNNFFRPACKLTLLIIAMSLGTAAWGSEKVIFDFTEKNNAGTDPETSVIADGAGNLYGTTFFASGKYKGVVYKLTPNSNGSWTESVLYTFDGGADEADEITVSAPNERVDLVALKRPRLGGKEPSDDDYRV